jgi:hypothetical protein
LEIGGWEASGLEGNWEVKGIGTMANTHQSLIVFVQPNFTPKIWREDNTWKTLVQMSIILKLIM